ncbi:hypothetical protein DFH28DRAFT_1140423 [Melampsora americana]|nr:hypothetical protein DFH28DRAFT_1140423 [Melampsora americana]
MDNSLQEFHEILKTISTSTSTSTSTHHHHHQLDLIIQSIQHAAQPFPSSISHQHQYLLQSILDQTHQLQFHPTKPNSSSFLNSLIQKDQFWSSFHQILSQSTQTQFIQSLSKSSIQSFIQLSFNSLSSLLNTFTHSKHICDSLIVLIKSISNRTSFESITDLLKSILDVLINLQVSISLEFEEIILILIHDLLSSLPQTSNQRKSILLASDQDFIHLLLSSISKVGLTSSIGSSLVRFLTNSIFHIDQLKRSLSHNTASRGIEKESDWLSSLRLTVTHQPQLATSAIQLLPYLIQALIKERSVIQAHVFAPIAATSTRPTSTELAQITNLESSQDFILHFLLSSHQLIQALVLLSTDSELVQHATNSIKTFTGDILTANLYSLSSRFHFEVLDQIASECVERLIESPEIATNAFQTLSDILSIDYRVIETRLPQILQSLFSKTFDEPSLLTVIESFLSSLIEWFSKAKQIPQLLNLIHDALDQNLAKSSLPILISAPFNSSVIIRKLQNELLLSVSSAQLNQAHATASDRLLHTYRTIFPFRGSDDERFSKKPKRSPESTESTTPIKSLTNDLICPSEVDVVRCVTYSHFYIILATATARSLLHTQDPQLKVALDDTLSELTSMISALCPESKKNKRARSSDGFLDRPEIQTVAATIFEIINATSELRHPPTSLTTKDLSRWLKFLSKAVNEKCELNPALMVQITQAALLQISANVTSDGIPGDTTSLAYDVILQLLDFKIQADMDTAWNGAFHSLTSSQIPCAIWYSFSTIHLSNFSDHGSSEQLKRLSRIILSCPPFPLIQTMEKKSQASICKPSSITFRQANAAFVSSPSLHELVRVCTSLLETGLDILRHVSSSDQISTLSSRDTTENLLLESIGLFAILAKLPLDCLPKSTRIEYLQKSLDWSLKICLGSSKKTSSRDDKIQTLVLNANIYSLQYITSLICATETTVDESLMSKVLSLATLLLSNKIDWESNDQNDVLYELSEIYIEQAISFIFRSMSHLKLSSPKAWEGMSSILLSRITKSQADLDRSTVKPNGLVIKALDSIINSISSSAPKHGASDHQVHDSWIKFVKALVQCTGEMVDLVSMTTSSLNAFQLEICSSHFRLVRIVGSIGLQVHPSKLPISKVIFTLDPNSSPITDCQTLVPSFNSPHQSLILRVIEEMINTRRTQVTQTVAGGHTSLIKAFQTLTVLYISSLVHTRGEVTQQVRELKHHYSVACRMLSPEEYSETLAALLEDYDRVLSSLNTTSKSARLDSLVKQLKATLDIGSILILHAPEGLGKVSQTYLSSFIRRFQHPIFGSLQSCEMILWRSRFLESLCTFKIKFIGRQDIALILELVLQSLALPNSNEEPNRTLDITANEIPNKYSREIYQSLITIISQLCRHRREHILPVFHLLMSILLGLLRPICQPVYLIDHRNGGSRNLIPSKKMIKEAKSQMPSWAWIESIDQTDWDRLGCQEDESLSYGRLLIGLGIKTNLIKKKQIESREEKMNLRPQVISLIPALSKHSPFYLKEYIKLCTGMICIKIPNLVETHLKNGIWVLLSSMGKHERLSIGKMLGEDWILEEDEGDGVGSGSGIDLEVGKEVWRKMLNGWEMSRYKGID